MTVTEEAPPIETEEAPPAAPVEEAVEEAPTELVDDSKKTAASAADWGRDRRSSIKRIMHAQKEEEEIGMGENVYSLLLVSPLLGWSWFFCMTVIFIKLAILCILLSDIDLDIDFTEEVKVTVVKGFLVPVAVTMQEDMMASFFFFANVMYNPEAIKISDVATKGRLYFCYTLRTIDGILSLFCNYFIMLMTERTLDVFLNFAALQFLYNIDDVFYEMAMKGFFGNDLEDHAAMVSKITLKRRVGKKDNSRILCLRISWLDTVLYFFSLTICFLIYGVVTYDKYSDNFNFLFGTDAPTVSPAPSFAPTSELSAFPSIGLDFNFTA